MARARVGLGLLGVLEQFCYGLEAHSCLPMSVRVRTWFAHPCS